MTGRITGNRGLMLVAGFALAACGGGGSNTADASARDAGVDAHRDASRDAGGDSAGADAGPVPLRACPVVSDCFLLTPVETGLPATGEGADVDQIALRPRVPTRGELLVFLNGSGGSPSGAASDVAQNFYTVARDEGLSVVALSYRSGASVGSLCPRTSSDRDACYEPTRLSILKGAPQPGVPAALSDITPDEGVYARLAAALRTLDMSDPEGRWGSFLDPGAADAESSIVWNRVLVSGHSQGGGHAALLGKLHPVARVLMLAAPCDAVAGAPASWVSRGPTFRTAATRFFALGAPDDSRICPAQFEAWIRLGMSASAGDGTASVCAGATAHAAPIRCFENASRWRAMLR